VIECPLNTLKCPLNVRNIVINVTIHFSGASGLKAILDGFPEIAAFCTVWYKNFA
jgi:hypothetical protein